MSKNEFLDILRQTLNGEVNSGTIEQNIKYYDQYISSQSPQEEERILELLGNPRLIAKTIIESEKAAGQKGRSYSNNRDNDSYVNDTETSDWKKHTGNQRARFSSNFSWRFKLALAMILFIVIILVIVIGRILLTLLFTFGIPILLIALLLAMFRKR